MASATPQQLAMLAPLAGLSQERLAEPVTRLGDEERPVPLHLHRQVGRRQREGLRVCRPREGEEAKERER